MDQLQSRLAYMEDEKIRLITAAKNKNEQVQQHTPVLPHTISDMTVAYDAASHFAAQYAL